MLKTLTRNALFGLCWRLCTRCKWPRLTVQLCELWNSLNLTGFVFPLAVKDVTKFEKQNPSISVNVLCSGDEGGFVPLHASKERDRPHHVNLFLIERADESKHYVWVKNLWRLVAGRTKTRNAAFVCNHCLHPFSNMDILEHHIPHCQRHAPQDV